MNFEIGQTDTFNERFRCTETFYYVFQRDPLQYLAKDGKLYDKATGSYYGPSTIPELALMDGTCWYSSKEKAQEAINNFNYSKYEFRIENFTIKRNMLGYYVREDRPNHYLYLDGVVREHCADDQVRYQIYFCNLVHAENTINKYLKGSAQIKLTKLKENSKLTMMGVSNEYYVDEHNNVYLKVGHLVSEPAN